MRTFEDVFNFKYFIVYFDKIRQREIKKKLDKETKFNFLKSATRAKDFGAFYVFAVKCCGDKAG